MEDNYPEYMPRPYVMVDGERVLTDDVEFVDISEDVFGRDVMTFIYKGKQHTSNVFIR